MQSEVVEFKIANTLITGITQRRLERAGIRALFIKGVFLSEQKLRAPKLSLDVDLLVHPDDVDSALEILNADGWYRKDAPGLRVAHEKHSATLLHPYWPNMIDLHRFWTGFIGDRKQIFDLLWESREEHRVQHVSVYTTEARASALILALHDIRSHGILDVDRRLGELAGRCETKWGSDTGALIHETARSLGAEYTAGPFLQKFGISISHLPMTPELREWNMQLRSEGRSVEGWKLRFRQASLRRKPEVVLDALALRPGQLRALRPDTPPGLIPFWKAWWERLCEALKWSRLHE